MDRFRGINKIKTDGEASGGRCALERTSYIRLCAAHPNGRVSDTFLTCFVTNWCLAVHFQWWETNVLYSTLSFQHFSRTGSDRKQRREHIRSDVGLAAHGSSDVGNVRSIDSRSSARGMHNMKSDFQSSISIEFVWIKIEFGLIIMNHLWILTS